MEYKLKGDNWFKDYFRQLLNHSHENMRIGDTLTFGIRFRKKNGSWTEMGDNKIVINKSDL